MNPTPQGMSKQGRGLSGDAEREQNKHRDHTCPGDESEDNHRSVDDHSFSISSYILTRHDWS